MSLVLSGMMIASSYSGLIIVSPFELMTPHLPPVYTAKYLFATVLSVVFDLPPNISLLPPMIAIIAMASIIMANITLFIFSFGLLPFVSFSF